MSCCKNCHIENCVLDFGTVGCDCVNASYQQGRADALSIDMDKPMHFTDEQKAWIKNYIIINAKRQRADAIDEFADNMQLVKLVECEDVPRELIEAIEKQIGICALRVKGKMLKEDEE